jgi:hypothetical protein
MKWLLLLSLLLVAVAVDGQTVQCPPDVVCLTPAEMKFYLGRDDAAKALEAEKVVLKQAIDDTKQIVNDLKVELAKQTGMLTGAQQSMVDARAVIQVLSANCKARNRIGLINF